MDDELQPLIIMEYMIIGIWNIKVIKSEIILNSIKYINTYFLYTSLQVKPALPPVYTSRTINNSHYPSYTSYK